MPCCAATPTHWPGNCAWPPPLIRYQQGRISQEWAANIAGMDRADFLLALSSMGRDSFAVDFEGLDNELARG